MATTTYDVNVRYKLDDQASKSVGMIGREAQKASRGIGILSGGMRMLQSAAVGFFGFRAAKKYLIDYNTALEQARITMGGLLMMNMGGAWSRNQKRANKLIAQFQQDAKASTATTKDFVDFAGLVTGPLSRAGASMEQIREVTKGGVIAAKAFGIEGEVAARDIEQALAGTLSKKDRFARALLEPMSITTDKWNEMVKKTPAKAADALVKAFNQPAIAKMAKAQENSWAGVVSTFQDNLERFMGSVGLPLMKELGKEMEGWNKWLTKNADKVKEWSRDFASALVDGFKAIKSGVSYMIEHRHTLLAIAKAWAAIKIGGMVGNLAGGAAGLLGKAGGGMGRLMTSLTTFDKSLKTSVGAIGGFATALALGIVAIKEFSAHMMREKEKQQKEIDRGIRENQFIRSRVMGMGRGDFGSMADIKGSAGEWTNLQRKNARFIANEIKRLDIKLDVEDTQARQQFAKFLGLDLLDTDLVTAGMQRVKDIVDAADVGVFATLMDATKEVAVGMLRVKDLIETRISLNRFEAAMSPEFKKWMKANGRLASSINESMFGAHMDFFSSLFGGPERKKPDNKQTINVKADIEVIGDDPDRIAVGLVGAFRDMAHRPTQVRDPVRIR